MEYSPPWWARNGHFQSIYPSLFRKVSGDFFSRERVETPDQDFLDLDWARNGNKRLVILTHGLEGHSRRPYVLGMAKVAIDNKWDVLAWNFRSCSGEINRKLTTYHSGQTHDLALVIKQAIRLNYDEICLIGFSIGGNKTLLYLGRNPSRISDKIIGAVTFSVPCDLSSSSEQLALPKNKLYMKNFLLSFKEKLKQKQKMFPGQLDLKDYRKIKSFYQFDSRYTAPLNGFESAEDYWHYASSGRYLNNIRTPTLLISALDDPFLTHQCYPYKAAEMNPLLHLETPRYGGHVGFMSSNMKGPYWSEKRAITYLNSLSKY